MTRERAAVRFGRQATACGELGSPLYGQLIRRAAEDIRAGGPCADAIAGYEEAPWSDAIALRLFGGVHALALTGRAPGLAAHYPSTGGTFEPGHPDAAWPEFRNTVAGDMEWVRDWMTRPPQTNEVGRANLLIAGLLAALERYPLPVRLFELGASAGLNLRAEQFRCTAEGFAWGPKDSPVTLDHAWSGAVPGWLTQAAERHPSVAVVERRGCDPTPIDPLSPDGALALRAYVWPDQSARLARLEGALKAATKTPADVLATGAADFLSTIEPCEGTLTVVWHSVMRQYVPPQEWARAERELDRIAAASGPEAGFAHIAFEPRGAADGSPLRLAVRLGDDAGTELAAALPHGLPAHELPD